jgi:epsilon-lactone hydrolase
MRRFLHWLVRLAVRPFLAPWVPLSLQRAWATVAGLTTRAPPGLARDAARVGGVPGCWLRTAAARPGHVLLYLHGGAYVIGGPGSHARLAAQVGHAAGAEVFFPDYRLAPEHPFPAALDDALAAYRGLLQRRPARLVVAGDSAGGGLALALAMAIRDAGLPAPAALVLISPWADLTLSGESHRTAAARDPLLRGSWLARCAALYAGGRPLDQPGLSPLFGDFAGLPPLLVQVGSEEILRSDAERVVERAAAAGTTATLSRHEGLWHDFQAHAGVLPEADAALADIGAFVAARASGAPA